MVLLTRRLFTVPTAFFEFGQIEAVLVILDWLHRLLTLLTLLAGELKLREQLLFVELMHCGLEIHQLFNAVARYLAMLGLGRGLGMFAVLALVFLLLKIGKVEGKGKRSGGSTADQWVPHFVCLKETIVVIVLARRRDKLVQGDSRGLQSLFDINAAWYVVRLDSVVGCSVACHVTCRLVRVP